MQMRVTYKALFHLETLAFLVGLHMRLMKNNLQNLILGTMDQKDLLSLRDLDFFLLLDWAGLSQMNSL
jgi:hypothetical protein